MEVTLPELLARIGEKDIIIGRLEAQSQALQDELARVTRLAQEADVDLSPSEESASVNGSAS